MAKSKILKELANNEITIDVALSRLLIISRDIDNSELLLWANNELTGYKRKEELPEYRKVRSNLFTYSGIMVVIKLQINHYQSNGFRKLQGQA